MNQTGATLCWLQPQSVASQRVVSHRVKHILPYGPKCGTRQEQLREFLQQHYPMPELSREIIQKARDLAEPA